MTRLIHLFLFLLCNCNAWAQLVVSTSSSSETTTEAYNPKFAVTLLAGQPNYIAGADIQGADQPFNVLHGELHRFSMGTGLCFRWYRDETFFLHARVMYSTRRYSIYDSIIDEPEVFEAPLWTNTTTRTFVVDNAYRMQNILFGIGGGHEGRFGKFVVRAGGEIDFISYSDVFVQSESRNYTVLESDSTNGGHYTSTQVQSFRDHTTSPGLWAVGITGHAALEYKVNTHFGIGATLYLGGFYCGVSDKTWTQDGGNSNITTDSHGNVNSSGNEFRNELPYTVRQFDFSPLNGQINFVYYFGSL